MINWLSGEELVQQNQQLQKNTTPTLTRGQKKTHPEPGDDAELQTLYNDLRTMLSLERIERVTVRSQAAYEPANSPHCVRVTRQMGKWQLYGYVRNGVQYLHPHEALHLVEINRLELHYDTVLCTLQQAYGLLLHQSQLSAEAYFVYSHLMRVGCAVEPYNRNNDMIAHAGQANNTAPLSKSAVKAMRQQERQHAECVWHCVYLLQTCQLAGHLERNRNDDSLQAMALKLAAHADRILQPRADGEGIAATEAEDEDDDGGWNVQPASGSQKRKASESSPPQRTMTVDGTCSRQAARPANRRRRRRNRLGTVVAIQPNASWTACSEAEDEDDDGGWNVQPASGSQKRKASESSPSATESPAGNRSGYPAERFLDRVLSDDRSEETARFAHIFRSISFARLAVADGCRDADLVDAPWLRIDFDLWLAPGAFRKAAPGRPDYRVVVWRSGRGVPTRRSVVRTHLWQRYRARLLVVFVGEAMAMQAFAYAFELD